MGAEYFYAYGIRRRNQKYFLGIKLDFNWISWNGRFPTPTGAKHHAKLFSTRDDAEIFQFKKAKKYPWILEDFEPRRIRVHFDDKILMIGNYHTVYRESN